MSSAPIIGRFAPTPSGPLHFGSLVTALASYCEARSRQGLWLVRIEDVDRPRVVEGSTRRILQDLESFGFEWDGDLLYQSDRFEQYEVSLQQLFEQADAYACACSRRSLRESGAESGPLGMIYPGLCRNLGLQRDGHSVRLNTGASGIVGYRDLLYGELKLDIEARVGDFVLQRADGIYAYHLAVVIDDALQGINQIVRGADLLEATCLHIYLQRLLGLDTPEYLHIPLVRNAVGDKLSKQTGATAVDADRAVPLLLSAMEFLGQAYDPALADASAAEVLREAVRTWDYRRIPLPTGGIY